MTPRDLGPGKLTRQRRSGGGHVYVFDYADAAGNRHRPRLGSNKSIAEKMARKLIEDRDLVRSGFAIIVERDRPWPELLDEYLGALALRTGSRHVEACRRRITRIMEQSGARRLADLGTAGVQAWQQRRAAEAAPQTVNNELQALRSFTKWAVRSERLGLDPTVQIKALPDVPAHPKRALSEMEIGRLLDAARRFDEACEEKRARADSTKERECRGQQWQALVPRSLTLRFLLKTGCRWGEMRQVTWADVYTDHAELLFRSETVKTRRARRFPIDAELGEILTSAHAAAHSVAGRIPRQSDPVLLTSRGSAWTRETGNFTLRFMYPCLEAAGIERIDAHGRYVTEHSLRHTFATRLLRAGVPLQQVMYLGGWRTSQVLERIYVHMEAEDARGAVEAVPLPSTRAPLPKNSVAGSKPAPLGGLASMVTRPAAQQTTDTKGVMTKSKQAGRRTIVGACGLDGLPDADSADRGSRAAGGGN